MRQGREQLRRRFSRLRRFDRDVDDEAWSAGLLAGVDEAGVGPLAGPVVAAAVILPADFELLELYDSKQMQPQQRTRCERFIREHALAVSVARVSPARIDRINILNAMLRAHRRALELLAVRPGTVVVDGRRAPELSSLWTSTRVHTVVRADSRSLCVAAASVVAKATRDRMMQRLDRRYPGYDFATHKGYATAAHKAAVRKLGLSPAHRLSFCSWLEDERLLARQTALAL